MRLGGAREHEEEERGSRLTRPPATAGPGGTRPWSDLRRDRPERRSGLRPGLDAALPEREAAGQSAGRGPARADDARGEDRPDDPGRARQRRRRHHQDHHRQPRQRAVRRRLGADAEHARRPGPTWSTATRRAALATRLHIPMLYGIDTVHGDGNMYGATVFPHNIGLGATPRPGAGRATSSTSPPSETRSSGPQWAFAPCICVARDDRWGRTYESFGETPALVEKMETAIDGFQGPPGHLSDNDRVLATAKHFAGDGLTTYGTGSNSRAPATTRSTRASTRSTTRRSGRLALAPYVPAVQQHHVGSVMPSYSDVDWTEDGLGNPINMHGNRDLITGVAEGPAGLQRVRDLRLQRHRPHRPGDRHVRRSRSRPASTPASTCSCSPTNFEEFESTLDGAGQRRHRPDGAHRRRGLADPHQEVRARALRAPLHRPHPPLRDRRRAPTAPSPGGPWPSRRCC